MEHNEQHNLYQRQPELKSSQAAKTTFSSFLLMRFRCSVLQEYFALAMRALNVLILFSTIYLSEDAMFAPAKIKIWYRNRLRVVNDMRIALSNINLSSLLMSRDVTKRLSYGERANLTEGSTT